MEKIFSAGVFVCVFNKDFSRILMLKRNKQKRDKYGADWGNVGGVLELGETSKEGVLREAREEIGVDLDPEKLKLIEVKEEPNYSEKYHSFQFIYVGVLDEKEKITINDESEEYRWFDVNDLPKSTLDKKEEIARFLDIAKKNTLR